MNAAVAARPTREGKAELRGPPPTGVNWASLPWPLLMAGASLATILLAYRARPDVFRRFAFGREEVALLSLGALAGWAVNLPIVPLGSSFLALNVGGALLALFLAGLWATRGLLPPLRVAVGIGLVAAITNAIVRFDPQTGIVALFPWFFLPPLAALFWALTVCVRDLRKAVPVAFVSGSVGALVGADLLNIPAIRDYFTRAQGEAVVVSVGGAGVFDMVFLAGVLPMAAAVLVLAALTPKPVRAPRVYPARPWEVARDAETWDRFARLTDANGLERAVASLALSNRALEDGDFARSVRMSYLAVDTLLAVGDPPLRDRIAAYPPALAADLAALAAAYERARGGAASREEAGAANRTAKLTIGALAAETGLPCRLEGP